MKKGSGQANNADLFKLTCVLAAFLLMNILSNLFSDYVIKTTVPQEIRGVDIDLKEEAKPGTARPTVDDLRVRRPPGAVASTSVSSAAVQEMSRLPSIIASGIVSAVIAMIVGIILFGHHRDGETTNIKSELAELGEKLEDALLARPTEVHAKLILMKEAAAHWCERARLLETQMQEASLYRNACIVLVSTAVAYPVSFVLGDIVRSNLDQYIVFKYSQTILLCCFLFIICFWRVYKLKKKTHFNRLGVLLATSAGTVAVSSTIWFVAMPPSGWRASSPIGWDTPLPWFGSVSFIMYQVVVKLLLAPLFAAIGGFVGYMFADGPRDMPVVEE